MTLYRSIVVPPVDVGAVMAIDAVVVAPVATMPEAAAGSDGSEAAIASVTFAVPVILLTSNSSLYVIRYSYKNLEEFFDSSFGKTAAKIEPTAKNPLAWCNLLIEACPWPVEETRGITTADPSKSKSVKYGAPSVSV